jgi:hypothetical protein
MAIEVYNGLHRISTKADLVARTSQCVAVGIVDSAMSLGGIVQIHFNNDHERKLYGFINDLICIDPHQPNYKLGVSGGVDAFVPGYGFIPGGANADRVLEFLYKAGFGNQSAWIVDVYEDFTRELYALISGRSIEIKRVEE